MGNQNTGLFKVERIFRNSQKYLKFSIHDFQKFKQALRNVEETEKTRINKRDEVSKNTITKTEDNFESNCKNKGIVCYSCDTPGHKASKCRKNKGLKFCNFCKSSSHNDKTCHKS